MIAHAPEIIEFLGFVKFFRALNKNLLHSHACYLDGIFKPKSGGLL